MARALLPVAEKAARGTTERAREAARMPAGPPAPGDPTPGRRRNYAQVAKRYAQQIVSGAIPASKWVRLACERQLADLARGAEFPYVWSAKQANTACAFLERLPHVEGRWTTPTIHLEPPQVFIVCALFGWRQRDDPTRRRFTTLYWELARKGAKS